jgi:hypothetical protein
MSEPLLTCPDCNSSNLDISIEDEEMIFRCEDCGWRKNERNYFYLDAWDVVIRQALAPVDILDSLLTDNDIIEFLKPRLKGVSYLSNYKDMSDEHLRGEVGTAHHIYLRQMVVLAVSYMELILKKFFKCLFIAQPRRMHAYLSEQRGKAVVSLREILRAPTKEELIMSLVEQAATIAIGPRFDKVIDKIVRECHIDLDRPFVEDVRALIELRNRIIHEDSGEEEIGISQVRNGFGLLLYLLYVLGCAAKKYQIPYRDDFGFLDEFQKQLRHN